MSHRKAISMLFCLSVLIASCKKDDPKPLAAQVNAALLAGQAGQSKNWKLIGLSYQIGSGAAQSQTLPGCYADNLYRFTNNEAQDYAAVEGVSKCQTGSPDTIESGSWAFSIDGLTLLIGVDNTQSANGLFTAEPYPVIDDQGTPEPEDDQVYALNIGYPYPCFVSVLTETGMTLEMNYVVSATTIKYTLTFVAV